MSDTMRISRRGAMAVGGAAALAMLGARVGAQEAAAIEKVVKNGRIKQSVSKWCFGKFKMEEFAAACQKMGLVGIDLLGPSDFPTLKKYGLVCTMTNCNGIPEGFNRKENHEKLIANLRKAIDATSEAGFPNVICFSGNVHKGQEAISFEEGAKNCIDGLKQIVGYAEEKKVTLCMELLNSKQHKDYMCDHTAWGAQVVKGVGSPRFKLLYDIYHMQMMEGDVIATIKQFKDCIGHVHTGGVPGRAEIDDTQEINYPPIMKALLDVKYDGYVAHEFIPKRDPLKSLAQAAQICDV